MADSTEKKSKRNGALTMAGLHYVYGDRSLLVQCRTEHCTSRCDRMAGFKFFGSDLPISREYGK